MTNDLDSGYSRYLVEYSFGNSTYSLLIPARNWEEAQERVKRIGAYGRVVGSDAITIPAPFGFLAKLLVWWRNLADTSR